MGSHHRLSGRQRRRIGRRAATRALQLFEADPLLVVAVLTLAGLGLLNLLAISETDLALHQALAVLIGFALMAFCHRARPHTRPRLGRAVYLGAVVMLLAICVMGVSAFGPGSAAAF